MEGLCYLTPVIGHKDNTGKEEEEDIKYFAKCTTETEKSTFYSNSKIQQKPAPVFILNDVNTLPGFLCKYIF
jgi:hypothetical protein